MPKELFGAIVTPMLSQFLQKLNSGYNPKVSPFMVYPRLASGRSQDANNWARPWAREIARNPLKVR